MKRNNSFDRRKFHYLQPDYKRPIYQVPADVVQDIDSKLKFLYKDKCQKICLDEIIRVMKVYHAHKTPEMLDWEQGFKPDNRFTEQDVILITYGDLIRERGQKPLHVMRKIFSTYFNDVFNTIHILPFFPYSSDRGFAVMDFEEVDPHLGTWDDILELKCGFNLMFDGVFNHVSSKSRWFQEFLNQNPDFIDFFTVFSTKSEISPDYLRLIVRPRTTELLSEFYTLNGKRLVWTTFSPDQIDLNYHNPKVLAKMVEILLTYVRRGADIIRLDAVTYLWEELGTSCVHLSQTHVIIKLFRTILDAVAPHVALITETNVPHEDNIRYFGNGIDEAQMVYNFALPPLVLHAFHNENSSYLTNWAATLKKPSDQATFFNFLDSHDGIGLMAVKNILPPEEIEMMALRALEHGGFISYKEDGDGTVSPYELNITWFSAINNENAEEPMELQVDRYIASRAIAMVLMGVPGIYFHGFLGSKNDAELVLEEKQTRSINRKNIKKDELIHSLENPQSTTYHVTRRMIDLIRKRTRERSFHPNSPQRILNLGDAYFSVLRSAVDRDEHILAIINITSKKHRLKINLQKLGVKINSWYDLITEKTHQAEDGVLTLTLKPYQIFWLKNI